METTFELYDHQKQMVETLLTRDSYALFWQQGVGKTAPIIIEAAERYRRGDIGALIVITDDGIHSNWADTEIPRWMPKDIRFSTLEYHSRKAKQVRFKKSIEWVAEFNGLRCLCMTWDAAVTETGKRTLWRFLQMNASLVFDETVAVKNPTSERTMTLLKVSPYGRLRRLLNGTPIDVGVGDLFSQMQLLQPHFWMDTVGIGSYTGYRSRYFITKNVYKNGSPFKERAKTESQIVLGREGKDYFKAVVGYRYTEEIKNAIDTISDRKLKDDVLSLPPKIYTIEFYSPSEEETRVYEALIEEGMATVGEETAECFVCNGSGELAESDCPKCLGLGVIAAGLMTAEQPIVKILRLQQTLAGYFVADGEPVADLPGPKPRLETLRRIFERGGGPWIVWSKFQRDVDKIAALCDEMGLRCGNYDGRTKSDRRSEIRRGFQNGEFDVFNGNPLAAAKGITLTRANFVIYFNNGYRYSIREQSEDRAHRAGLDHKVVYIDICAHGTIDMKVLANIRKKMEVAAEVLGDKLRDWVIA